MESYALANVNIHDLGPERASGQPQPATATTSHDWNATMIDVLNSRNTALEHFLVWQDSPRQGQLPQIPLLST